MPLLGFEHGIHAQAFEPLGHQAPVNYVLNFKTAVFRNTVCSCRATTL